MIIVPPCWVNEHATCPGCKCQCHDDEEEDSEEEEASAPAG